MFAKERQDRILQLLNEKGAVKISELTGIFSVSVETIRRDLMELEHRNCLSRVHGGALRIPRSGEYPVRSERAGKNRERKGGAGRLCGAADPGKRYYYGGLRRVPRRSSPGCWQTASKS